MKWLAGILLILLGQATVMLSDFFLRAKGLDNFNGIDCSSYDFYGSALILFGCWVIYKEVKRNG